MDITKLMLMVTTVLACILRADIYVDGSNPLSSDKPCEGRGTANLPYRTIQAAVDAAPPDGTVRVLPGVYEEGEQPSPVSESDRPSRLLITKRVTISSTDGASVTEIRGRHGVADSHLGNEAVRCIFVTEEGSGAVIEGFTIANGATYSGGDSASYARGGGLRAIGECYVVDCVFTNCFASLGGALCGGTAIRCFFRGNGGPVWQSATAAEANLWNSVVVHDYFYSPSSGSQKSLTAVTNVNCTVINMNGNYSDFYNCESYNLLSCAFAKAEVVSGTSRNCIYRKDGKGVKHCTNPFRGDFRLLSTSAAINAGDASFLESVFDLPSFIERKDFTGNDLSGRTGAIHAGASQSVSDPLYAGIELNDNKTLLRIDGVQLPVNGYMYAQSYPESWVVESHVPADWNISNFSTNILFYTRSYVSGSQIARLYPLRDGTFRTLLPREPATFNFSQNSADETLWVDANIGSDETGDGSSGCPYGSLQKAVDVSKATAGTGATLILALPGVYDVVDGLADGVAARIAYAGSCNLAIRAVGGPEKTVIVGSPDGEKNVRCASGDFVLQGFTLRNGRTCGETAAEQEGAIAKNTTLLDCVVSNCTSTTYACIGANGHRVRFTGNASDGNLIASAVKRYWTYCSFVRNVCGLEMVRGNDVESCLCNCTFRGNETGKGPLLATHYAVPVNCVFDMNGNSLSPASCSGYTGNICWNAAQQFSYEGYTWVDPLFSGDINDIHVAVDSPVRGAGVLDSGLWYQKDVWQYASADVFGNPVTVHPDGRIDAGAVQGAFLSSYILTDPIGSLKVDGGTKDRYNLPYGTSVTLSVSKAATARRNVIGVIVTEAGVVMTNLFDDCENGIWTRIVDGDGVMVSIMPCTSIDWFVDPVNGDDDADGFTPKTAKLTLAEVSTNVALLAGDVIHALPGTYDIGKLRATPSSQTYVRALVPSGVTLVADAGWEETVIVGDDSPNLSQSDGCGEDAIRAVELASGAKIIGFTISHGRSLHRGDATLLSDTIAGVLGADATSEVVDCRFVDCKGVVCCGSRATFRRCKARACGTVHGNSARDQFSDATLVDCLVADSSQGRVVNKCVVYNSTLTPYPGWHCVIGDNSSRLYNSVIYGFARKQPHYYRCVFATNKTYVTWNESDIHHYPENAVDCIFTNVEAVGLSSEWRPGSALALTVDAGFNSYLPPEFAARSTDVDGVPRVMNGSVDIGAFEWDERPSMRQVLSSSVSSVIFASSNVFTIADGVLFAGSDAELEGRLRVLGGSGKVRFHIAVDGDAVLHVCRNGLPDMVFSGGTFDCLIEEASSNEIVNFRLEGDGSATIAGIPIGFRLIVR